MNNAQIAANILSNLGKTPDELAEFFLKNNMKGVRYDYHYCPCGHFLRDILEDRTLQTYPSFCLDKNGYHSSNSKHVTDFIIDFDQGKYPELVLSREEFIDTYGE